MPVYPEARESILGQLAAAVATYGQTQQDIKDRNTEREAFTEHAADEHAQTQQAIAASQAATQHQQMMDQPAGQLPPEVARALNQDPSMVKTAPLHYYLNSMRAKYQAAQFYASQPGTANQDLAKSYMQDAMQDRYLLMNNTTNQMDIQRALIQEQWELQKAGMTEEGQMMAAQIRAGATETAAAIRAANSGSGGADTRQLRTLRMRPLEDQMDNAVKGATPEALEQKQVQLFAPLYAAKPNAWGQGGHGNMDTLEDVTGQAVDQLRTRIEKALTDKNAAKIVPQLYQTARKNFETKVLNAGSSGIMGFGGGSTFDAAQKGKALEMFDYTYQALLSAHDAKQAYYSGVDKAFSPP